MAVWFRNLPGWAKAIIALTGGVFIGTATYWALVQRDRKTKVSEDGLKKKDVTCRILILGLYGSGKSSILSRLSKVEKEKREIQPTEGFNVICLQTSDVTINIWEIGGGDKVRKYWSNFILQETDLLVFVVDSSSEEHINDAEKEFNNLITDIRLNNVPVLLLANKQDMPGALSPFDIEKRFGCVKGQVNGHSVRVLGTRAPPDLPSHPSIWEAERFMITMSRKK